MLRQHGLRSSVKAELAVGYVESTDHSQSDRHCAGLCVRLVEAGLLEQRRTVVENGVDARQLLGELHNYGDY